MPFSLAPQPGENEYECARCGAIVHGELTRCPKCGVNLYEPEDEDEYSAGVAPASEGLLAKIGRFFRRLWGEPHPADALFRAPQQQAALYNDLLAKAGGDPLKVKRLIEFEETLLPKANRTVWLQNAVRRWERDNR